MARQTTKQLFCFIIRLATMLPYTVLRDLKLRMVTTFPMQLEMESMRICCDDDLLKHRAQNPLACYDRRTGMIPQSREI